jgi:two-component system, NtrC family, response regulator AtoC
MARILIVDDKENLCRSLTLNFARFDHNPVYATNANDALELFVRTEVEAVVLDLKLGGDDGISLLRQFHSLDNSVPVVILTGYGTVQTAVEAIKHGAYHYVEKPARFEDLRLIVERAVSRRQKTTDTDAPASGKDVRAQIVTEDPELKSVLARAQKLADSDIPVLIQGESGTGKELLAELIHACSARKQRELVRVNCAALPESLLDNELFGHEKGAFTGADRVFRGLFEQANTGTLFLDEIADLSLSSQAKILRVIQNRELRRIGGSETIRVDVRFIGATNRNVSELVHSGGFREDLYYRLNAATLTLPPLRQRPCDIPILVRQILSEFSENHTIRRRVVSEPVMRILMKYEWPGNVRELRNALAYAATVAGTSTITADDLPGELQEARGETPVPDGRGEVILSAQRGHILWALEQTGNNKKRAAELLRISRKTLYNRMARYGIEGTV